MLQVDKVPLDPRNILPCNPSGSIEGQKIENVQITGPVEHVNCVDCSYINVELQSLQNVRFTRCTFVSCTFAGEVSRTEFATCKFSGCSFQKALDRVAWTTCTGRGISIEHSGTISSWRLQHCVLHDVKAVSVNMLNIEFQHSTLTGLTFKWVVMSHAKFEQCTLHDANIHECTLNSVLVD